MIQYFPTSRFKCLTQNQIHRLDVNKIEENNPEDCILKVDLESPKELHNKNKHVLNNQKLQLYLQLRRHLQNSIGD